MIKLKNILSRIISEQVPSKKLNVLFVGDSQTAAPWSYANTLIKSGRVTGDIVAKNGASTSAVLQMLRSNISDEYDVVSIMAGGNDGASPTPLNAIENFKSMFQIVNQHGAKLVVVTNPTKRFIQPGDSYYKKQGYPSNDKISNWLATESDAYAVIDTGDFNKADFTKDHVHLDSDGHFKIADLWKKRVANIDVDRQDEPASEKWPVIAKYGDRGDVVYKLQQLLINLGFEVGPMEDDGIYGPYTKKGVTNFQKDIGFEPTGIYDENTQKELEAKSNISLKSLLPRKEKSSITKLNIASSATATGATIIDFFVGKGLTPEQSAGIAGNLYIESTFKTGAIGDRGTSKGLAQWHNERWSNLVAWCEGEGMDPYSVTGQLEFLWHELTTTESKALTKLKQTQTPSDAAHAFARWFERPSIIHRKRKDAAETLFADYK
jgi:peptidoglycan hydrolase-like protein with peptidoglycan-binding domain